MNHCRILKQKALLSEDKIKCSNLKKLTLCSVTVTESALDSLISCCSQIVTISFQYCIGFIFSTLQSIYIGWINIPDYLVYLSKVLQANAGFLYIMVIYGMKRSTLTYGDL
uniref:F-box/LRR-repeat protein 15/At3g58940/PEG3-like LRR domain-containing protein n=1 Tax=Solanum tuberosum TaxID=4113 RepID=M1CEG5_SOLTU